MVDPATTTTASNKKTLNIREDRGVKGGGSGGGGEGGRGEGGDGELGQT